jgi:hypothetical protein
MITTIVKDEKDILRKKKMCEYERKRETESMGGTLLKSTKNPNACCQSIRMPILWQNNAIIL